jgi:hypothetical protein
MSGAGVQADVAADIDVIDYRDILPGQLKTGVGGDRGQTGEGHRDRRRRVPSSP